MIFLMKHKKGYGKGEHKISKKFAENQIPLDKITGSILTDACQVKKWALFGVYP